MSNPKKWGANAWHLIHAVTFAFPENPTDEDRRQISRFFESLCHLLPCAQCRPHFRALLERNPVESHCDSKDNLCRWCVDVHNQVNKRLGKAEVPFEQVRELYDAGPTTPQKKPEAASLRPSYAIIGVLLSLLLLVLVGLALVGCRRCRSKNR